VDAAVEDETWERRTRGRRRGVSLVREKKDASTLREKNRSAFELTSLVGRNLVRPDSNPAENKSALSSHTLSLSLSQRNQTSQQLTVLQLVEIHIPPTSVLEELFQAKLLNFPCSSEARIF